MKWNNKVTKKELTFVFLFANDKHLYLQKLQVHLFGGVRILPCTYSHPELGTAWGFVILPTSQLVLER